MINKPVIGVAVAVVVVAAGTWYYLQSRHAEPARPPEAAQTPPPAEPPAEPTIRHPLPGGQAPASTAPLPSLADSDPALGDALRQVVGPAAVIDNLPRQKVAVQKRPTAAAGGSFVADGDELHATLNPQNFARYQPMVAVIGKLDMRQVAAVYIRFYPLFQQAYQDLGYPNGYFNDRLVQVIDMLLETPQPAGPIALARPNVMYVFADPALEARPAGQKLLIRMGPDNAAVIKTKLDELRTAITAAPPKR